MLVPLGSIFTDQVLAAGPSGFGLMLTALGCGLAVGMLGLGFAIGRLPAERTFVVAVLGAGACIFLAASMHTLIPALVFIAGLGFCAGAVYALGFSIVQANVDDEVRGRTFAMLYTVVRVCVLAAFAVAPLLSDVLDRLSAELFDKSVNIVGIDIALPGVRVTMWIAGAIIVGAGLLARAGLGVSVRNRRVVSAA
jgi:dTMP kinase